MALTIAQSVFVAYLAGVLLVGVIASRFTRRTPSDYYIADRTVGTLILGLTFVATVLSSFTVFGIGEHAVQTGLSTFSFLAIAAVFYTLVFATVGVTLYRVGRDMDVVTPSQYIRQRYESRGVSVLYLVVTGIFMMALIAGQILGAGVALDALMDIPFEVAIVTMAVFMLVYIHIAGYRGVIWSDTMQSIVLFGALGGVVAYVMAFREPDAMAADATAVTEGILSLVGPANAWTPLFIMTAAFAFVFGVPAYPHTIQRYFSARNAATLRRSGFVFAIVAIPIYLFGTVLGAWSPAVIPVPDDPMSVIPLVIDAMMHPIVFGIVMAGAVAAIMSTADSVALTMSSMISRDVLVEFVDPDAGERREVRITQGLLVAVIGASLVLAWVRPAGIFALIDFAVVGFAATSAPVFLGAYWRGATAAGAATSLIFGPAITILFFLEIIPATYQFGMHYGFIGMTVSYVIFVGVSAATSTPASDAIDRHSRPFGTPRVDSE